MSRASNLCGVTSTVNASRATNVWAVLLVLLCAGLLVSCGIDTDEGVVDSDGDVVCTDLPAAPDPLPQIYVLDLEDPQILAETYEIAEPAALSIVRRDVVDRTPVHFGWHRGGVVAPVKVWSQLSGVDPTLTFEPVAVDGLRTTDDLCEPKRFDALSGFYDYIAIEGVGDQARQFDVVGASDGFLTTFIGEPRPLTPNDAAVGALMDDFNSDRSPFTNRRYAVFAAAALAALAGLWLFATLGRRVRRRGQTS